MIKMENLSKLDKQPLFKDVLKKWATDVLIHQNTNIFESLDESRQEEIKNNQIKFDRYVSENGILINPGNKYFAEVNELKKLLA